MKLLLDENLPVRLKYRFSSAFEVHTVTGEGWSGIKDRNLLERMTEKGFSILVTADKNLPYQQNLEKYGVLVLVLYAKDNRYQTLLSFVSEVEKCLPPQKAFGMIEVYLPTNKA